MVILVWNDKKVRERSYTKDNFWDQGDQYRAYSSQQDPFQQKSGSPVRQKLKPARKFSDEQKKSANEQYKENIDETHVNVSSRNEVLVNNSEKCLDKPSDNKEPLSFINN